MGMLSRYAFSMSAAAALLVGCGALSFGSAQGRLAQGDMQPPVVAPRAVERNTTSSYSVLYRFGGHPDGQQPQGALLNVNGTLYGTTYEGGRACNKRGGPGCGTVYSIDTSGTEKVLYRFQGDSDGTGPKAGLIDGNGTLYGTTFSGGFTRGTVYSVGTSGTEKVLYAFRGDSDGDGPVSSLIDVKGTLYGTTPYGGKYGPGTVYSIGTNGTEKVLYSFGKGTDGKNPRAGLIDVKGTLYGTTYGGGGGKGCAYGCGTVYSVTTGGTEKVLYSFKGGSDGAHPQSELIDVNGKLYGTTSNGGNYSVCKYGGCGTVYGITTSGKEKVLHRFDAGSDGAGPAAALIDAKGTLYGTTLYGGNSNNCSGGACGTVFSVTTGGTERVLHSFAGGSDGMYPMSPLIDVNGTLYGTTPYGGNQQCFEGCGTVFTLHP